MVVYSFDDPDLDKKDRIERMVIARNSYLKMVKAETQFVPDYLIAVDGDVDFKINGVINAIDNAPDDWVSLSANGIGYSKLLMFKFPVYYRNVFAFVPFNNPDYMLTENEMYCKAGNLQRMLETEDYIKCVSAFGGIGIYRYQFISNVAYVLEENEISPKHTYLCEHIPFNMSLLKYGNNYVCKQMYVYYEKVKFKHRIKSIIGRLLIKITKK